MNEKRDDVVAVVEVGMFVVVVEDVQKEVDDAVVVVVVIVLQVTLQNQNHDWSKNWTVDSDFVMILVVVGVKLVVVDMLVFVLVNQENIIQVS